jgi:cytochrome c2
MRHVLGIMAACAAMALASCASPGEKLFKERCSKCHSPMRAKVERKTPEQWRKTVHRMREHGADLTDTEAEIIIKHLSRKHGV